MSGNGWGRGQVHPFVLSSWELLPSLTSSARLVGFCVRTSNPDLFDKTRSINKPRSNICVYELAINRRTSFYRSLPLLGIDFSPLGSCKGGYEKGPPLPCQSLVIREWELVLLVGWLMMVSCPNSTYSFFCSCLVAGLCASLVRFRFLKPTEKGVEPRFPCCSPASVLASMKV